jgi:hypothetical protein
MFEFYNCPDLRKMCCNWNKKIILTQKLTPMFYCMHFSKKLAVGLKFTHKDSN